MLTLERLLLCMPKLTAVRAYRFLPFLRVGMAEGDITTALRAAAFLAQLAHESGHLRYWEELASGAAYEGRHDLGNTEPGDGVRFKGRGPIQLTGRTNYRRAGAALELDLVGHPERAAQLDVGFRTAAWFWTDKRLNQLADVRAFDAITLRINGGLNGKPDRDALYQRARAAFGI